MIRSKELFILLLGFFDHTFLRSHPYIKFNLGKLSWHKINKLIIIFSYNSNYLL